jgi:hypothetical protein
MTQKITQISDKLFLTTRDVLTPTGTLRSIEYELDVQKNKVVLFEIDFSGSVNLVIRENMIGNNNNTTTTTMGLLPNGNNNNNSEMSKRTIVEPFTKSIVAIVDVKDPNKGWALETKYTWLEENPNTVLPGQAKREKLSEGVYAVTTRSSRVSPSQPDTFTCEIQVDKNATVRVTLDASQSTNLEFKNGGKVATIVVPPFSTAIVGTLIVVNPSVGYTLSTKWNWSETVGTTGNNNIQNLTSSSTTEFSSPAHYYGSNNNNNTRSNNFIESPTAAGLATQPYQHGMNIPTTHHHTDDETRIPNSLNGTSNNNRNNINTNQPSSLVVNSSNPKCRIEEISPGVILSTETIEGTWEKPTEILYYLKVDKATHVDFTADFSGSTNLRCFELIDGKSSSPLSSHTLLQPRFSSSMIVRSAVNPFQTALVAHLQCVDSTLGWKLLCKYKWEEEDITIPSQPPPPPPNPVASTSSYFQQQQQMDHNSMLNNRNINSISPSSSSILSGSGYNGGNAASLNALLTGLGMEAYIPTFQQEELTLDLLRVMARDEAEFRHSLQVLGISKMGHREKILLAVKQSI